jgi:hypothetical protein
LPVVRAKELGGHVQNAREQQPFKSLVSALGMALILGGCVDDDGGLDVTVPRQPTSGTSSTSTTPSASSAPSTSTTPLPSTTPPATQAQQAPQIRGVPPNHALVDQRYVFQPTASDPNGDQLTFTIAGKPSWLLFNATTGRLTGTPRAADVRTYQNVTIQVSDGARAALLQPFSIEVVNTGGQRAVSLSWIPPTENEDGSPITNLGGYKIRYGAAVDAYDKVIDVPTPGLTSYMIDGLVPGTYYFAMAAYTTSGIEGANSAAVSTTLR